MRLLLALLVLPLLSATARAQEEPSAPPAVDYVGEFDAALQALVDDSLAIYELAGTSPTWPSETVQAGFQILFHRNATFVNEARALLADAQAKLEACSGTSGGTDPPDPGDGTGGGDPGGGDPPDTDPPTDPPTEPPLVYTENGVFASGGSYDWLADPTDEQLAGAELGGFELLWSAGWKSSKVHNVPASMSDRTVVWNNTAASWGERGPKWGMRAYNVGGALIGLTQWRVGDWTGGREGHGLYFNPLDDLLIEDVHAIECGAQAIQLAWRPRETKVHPSQWLQPQKTLTLRNVSAINCGAINKGSAVRASWPFALYASGHSIQIDGMVVRTNLAQPFMKNGQPRRSHGGLFIGPAVTNRTGLNEGDPGTFEYQGDVVRWQGGFVTAGQDVPQNVPFDGALHKPKTNKQGQVVKRPDGSTVYVYRYSDSFQAFIRTPEAVIVGLDIEVTDSDRDEVRFRYVESVRMVRPRIVEHGGRGDVSIEDDCGRVEIIDPQNPIWVTVFSASDRYRNPISTTKVSPGQTFVWPN